MQTTYKVDAVNFSRQTTSMEYPCLLIKELSSITPVVLDSLEKGEDIAVIGELNGKRKLICKMSKTAFNINKILKTHSGGLEYMISADESVKITTIQDYVEVFKWTS